MVSGFCHAPARAVPVRQPLRPSVRLLVDLSSVARMTRIRDRRECRTSCLPRLPLLLLKLLAVLLSSASADGSALSSAEVADRWQKRSEFWRSVEIAWPLFEDAVYHRLPIDDACHCLHMCLSDRRCAAVDLQLTPDGPRCRLAGRRGNSTSPAVSTNFTAARLGLAAFGEHCLSDAECGWDVVAARCLSGLCACPGQQLGEQCVVTDCAELAASPPGVAPSGEYWIEVADSEPPLSLFCDMETDGGGWTVFQRRQNDTEQLDFYRDWQSYRDGFGNVSGQFWLGNELIHRLTARRPQQLRIDMFNFAGEHRFAQYLSVTLAGEDDYYRLYVAGPSGNAGGSFNSCNGQKFSTKDADHDTYSGSCATLYFGGWWYSSCHGSNLNGLYLWGNTSLYARGVCFSAWMGYYYSLKHTEMKLRPSDFVAV